MPTTILRWAVIELGASIVDRASYLGTPKP